MYCPYCGRIVMVTLEKGKVAQKACICGAVVEARVAQPPKEVKDKVEVVSETYDAAGNRQRIGGTSAEEKARQGRNKVA